jgi:acyl-CoA thioester hydrolase
MPINTSTIDLRVRYAETDQMGVVYHSHYLVWCEMGRTNHIRECGMSYREMEESGLALAVAEASIRYRAPARYDDLVRVETTLAEVGSRSITFDYVITNGETGTRLATARTVLIALDGAHRVTVIPPEIREILTHNANDAA